MRLLCAASQLVTKLISRGDYAPAPQGVLKFVPFWNKETQWIAAALAELVPGDMCTARVAVPDDPVYAVTQRNLLVSFVSHALNQVLVAQTEAGEATEACHETAERLPREALAVYLKTPTARGPA